MSGPTRREIERRIETLEGDADAPTLPAAMWASLKAYHEGPASLTPAEQRARDYWSGGA